MSNSYKRANKALESQFLKLNTFRIGCNISEKKSRTVNLTQNEHVYANFCPPEVAGDFISGGNVKTVEGYVVLNFEAASMIKQKALTPVNSSVNLLCR